MLTLLAVLLLTPRGIAVDTGGNIYISDTSAHVIRKIHANGYFRTLAGTPGESGSTDAVGLDARFNRPEGLAVDSVGNLYVADTENHTIRKVNQAGIVTTIAGKAGEKGSVDGKGEAARFDRPLGIAIDRAGNLIVADCNNRTIRHITPDGVVTTYAGVPGKKGQKDGPARSALFDGPSAVAVDRIGNVYVADTFANTIRKIGRDGNVTTIAGKSAHLENPVGLATDREGNVFVADWVNGAIRKITPEGKVLLFAGQPSLPKTRQAGKCCLVDGMPHLARFAGPYGLAIDREGNLYVADTFNSTIRQITPEGVVSTVEFHD